MPAVPMDLVVAATHALEGADAASMGDRASRAGRRRNDDDDDGDDGDGDDDGDGGAPEFAFDSDSSSWTSSDAETARETASETDCDSIDASDLPSWLTRVRDGADVAEDEYTDAAHAEPPRTRNEIELEARKVVVIEDIDAGEAIRSVGRVTSVVGRVVVVASAPGRRGGDGDGDTLDEESVLCLKDRTGLGAIEEVFGPVSSPLYSVRLPTAEDAGRAPPEVEVDDEVFVVVGRSRMIPNVKNLYKKGYDASGKDDEEVVEDEEFSDDEKEAAAKAARKKPAKKRSASARGGRSGGSNGPPPPPPPVMGGGGYFGMQGLPRPPPPGRAPGANQNAPTMYVPVTYDAQGQPVIMMPQGYGGANRAPPPPPPPPPPRS